MAEKDPWDFSEFGERQAGDVAPADPRRGAGSGRSDHGFDTGLAGDSTPMPPAEARTGFAGLAGADLGSAALTVARPPLLWLAASAAAAIIGLLLAALLGAMPPLAVIGWVLAGPVAIGALAAYTAVDTRRRAQPVYVAPNGLTAGYYACLAICLIGVVVSAIRIALWVGRW